MSAVYGLRLADGREVAVKARKDECGRASACVQAQLILAGRGFPCPRPLTQVTVEAGMAIHAEEWRPEGEMLRGSTPAIARRFGELLARLMSELAQVTVKPPLPNPYWLRWDHGGPGLWPAMGFLDERDQSLVPEYIVAAVTRAAGRLLRAGLPPVLGYADFETQNIRWLGGKPWSVHDWDSLAWMPEAAIVGAASGAFTSAEIPTLAPLESSEMFIAAYQEHRGREFSPEENQVEWAASVWLAVHNARCEALFGSPPTAGAPLREQMHERLRRAGA